MGDLSWCIYKLGTNEPLYLHDKSKVDSLLKSGEYLDRPTLDKEPLTNDVQQFVDSLKTMEEVRFAYKEAKGRPMDKRVKYLGSAKELLLGVLNGNG